MTPERVKLERVQEDLDEGRELAALRGARDLMDSSDAEIRSGVVSVFTWIGPHALKELVEMARDKSPQIAEEAITGWDQAVTFVDGDKAKLQAVIFAAAALKDNASALSIVLQHMSDFDEDVALVAVARLIFEHPGTVLSESARETYTHVSGGEIFVSVQDTEKFVRKKRKDQ